MSDFTDLIFSCYTCIVCKLVTSYTLNIVNSSCEAKDFTYFTFIKPGFYKLKTKRKNYKLSFRLIPGMRVD